MRELLRLFVKPSCQVPFLKHTVQNTTLRPWLNLYQTCPKHHCAFPISTHLGASHLLLKRTTTSKESKLFHTSSRLPTKALTIWRDVKELRSSPVPALVLGFSGLIPFSAAPVYMISQAAYLPHIAIAQIAYGACILSFIGGVRWGMTLPEESSLPPDWINLGYSVIPSLIAWAGLLMPASAGLITVMGGLGLTAYLDITMYGYPSWFKGLRFLLSFVAILALWTSFMCSIILPHGKEELENIDEAEVEPK